MARRKVTDPELLRQLNAPQQTAPARRKVTDPAILQKLENTRAVEEAAKKRRILEIGQAMPSAETGKVEPLDPSVYGGPPTMANSRVTQAFETAAAPEANQQISVPGQFRYGFTENMMSRLPFGDEAAALGGGIGRYAAGKTGLAPEKSFGESMDYARAMERMAQEQYRREHPGGDVSGTLLGMAAGGAPTGAAAALGVRAAPAAAAIPATVAGRALEGIKGGTGLGALYGAGEGEGLDIPGRAVNAATGAAIGAGTGAALPYLGAAGRSVRRLRNNYDPAIGGHVQRLNQEADNFYTQMDQAGVQLSRPAFNRILTNIQVRARHANIDPDLNAGPTAVVRALQRDIQDLSRAPTLRRMDQIRQKIRDAPTASANDRRILNTMVEGLEDNLSRLTPRDLVGGNLQTGMTALKEGRRLQKQFYKAETVDTLVENAKDALGANYTQAGLQTGIRQQFRALNKKIRTNPKERGRWTNEERRLINLIVRGGSGENIGRWLGMLALRGRGGASAYATGTAAGAYGGLGPLAVPLAAGAAGIGELAKRTSTARGIMNAEALDRLIGTGSTAVPPRQLGPVSQKAGQLRRLATGLTTGLGTRLLTGE